MKNRIGILIAAGIVLLAAAFLMPDFHIAKSQTTAEQRVATYRTGTGMPQHMQNAPVLTVAVEGDDAFAEALRQALRDELGNNNPQLGNVELVSGAPDAAGDIYLLVRVRQTKLLWTPVYGNAQVEVEIFFSSNGDVSWRDVKPVVMTSEEGPVIKADGEITVRDTTWGLVSRPGYRRLVAQALASKINDGVKTIWKSVS